MRLRLREDVPGDGHEVVLSQGVAPVLASRNKDGLEILKGLIEAGKVTPVIDRTYPLSEVPDAIRCLEEGHARGKIVIMV